MKRLLCLFAWIAFVGLGATWLGQTTFGDEGTVFQRRSTWRASMVATRVAYQRWLDEEPSRGESYDPWISGPMTGDSEAEHVVVDVTGWRWMRLLSKMEKSPGNCHIWGNAFLVDREGRKVWLDALAPAAVKVGWGSLLKNKNWQNQPLRVGEQTFERGIWVHADSDVTYQLGEKFVRFEAWVGLDAARAQGQARFQVWHQSPEPLTVAWQQMEKAFPRECERFVDDARGRHLEWFTATDPSTLMQATIRRVAGSPEPKSKSFEKLVGDVATSGDDEQLSDEWIGRYLTATEVRQCVSDARAIWILDLQERFSAEISELIDRGVQPGAAEWSQLQKRIRQVVARMPKDRSLRIASLTDDVKALENALPNDTFSGHALSASSASLQTESTRLIEAVVTSPSGGAAELTRLMDRVVAFRRSLLRAVDGMEMFLSRPAHRDMEREWEQQYATLLLDLAKTDHFRRVAAETYRRDALIWDEDRDPADVVLRRTESLLADIARRRNEPMTSLWRQLRGLQEAARRILTERTEARYVLFAAACRLRREVAFQNPLLDFTDILFIKRHRALFNHMCDQYYGMAATPGGGLYVLEDAFADAPKVRDVLADSQVERGRLKGQYLRGGSTTPPNWKFDGQGNLIGDPHEGGSFLSPDLSYDGKTVLFAYVECKGDPRHHHHTDATRGHWDPGRCYHIFKVNLGGSHLEQLTDGTWNDFDPCWLPNGRIAFITERRGGYLRCGRVCPTYTLFDMASDGSDMTCLSFHETNEWHPSVTHDGSIVWTRWDYVDRHGCTAHMPWITTLDGRDPRPVHGNYAPREKRPDMEADCRSIPGSRRFIATAAPHHGQAYGSLVIIDPEVPDDDAMAPVRRVTPEVGFPETQGGAQVYGTPWPLSEDYYLCVYDAAMQPGLGRQGRSFVRGDYGIYLVDSFGNKELLYRDPEIGCLSPIPVRPRPVPGTVPEMVKRGQETNPATRHQAQSKFDKAEATVALINVYDSLLPWPEGTHIAALRVLQVLPMSVPSGRPPHETALRVATAGDSVVPVRHVLGTVPVEEDGSAHFVVPANREIFFQALDENGLAIQSMRSATHLHEGERLVCNGCHAPRHKTQIAPSPLPIALRRAPSQLKPDVDGTKPFSYPRLVQPVLDRHCVACHNPDTKTAPNLAREPIVRNWYASYHNLVRDYGFHDYGDRHRTIPGRFGARASKLYQLLQQGHYDVELPPEDLHRLTLWLDCTSMFYGVYEREGGIVQLQGGIALPTLE